MKKKRNKWNICLVLAALLLVLGLSVESALAYFTAFDTAEGGVKLSLGFTETIPEEEVDVENGKKEIVLENTGDYDCYVRLIALTGDKYKESLRYSGDSKWTPGEEGYYYYSDILAPGEKTAQIDVSFSFPEEEPADFNVIIIQENTPVLYDAEGNPYPDWDVKADISESVYE